MKQLPDNIVLFDGTCGLCMESVEFVIRHDRRAVFQFAALQSETGRQLCSLHGLDPTLVDSVVLIGSEGVRLRSDAALEIVRQLSGAWRWLAILRVVPRPVRDWIYRMVALNRHRWLRRNPGCAVPSERHRDRFLP